MTNQEKIKNEIRKYTHDRSKSGYDDILGSCPLNCYQCKKDERFVEIILSKLTEALKSQRIADREELVDKILDLELITNPPDYFKDTYEAYNEAIHDVIIIINSLSQEGEK